MAVLSFSKTLFGREVSEVPNARKPQRNTWWCVVAPRWYRSRRRVCLVSLRTVSYKPLLLYVRFLFCEIYESAQGRGARC